MPKAGSAITLCCLCLLLAPSLVSAANKACTADDLMVTIDLIRDDVTSVVIDGSSVELAKPLEQGWAALQNQLDSEEERKAELNEAQKRFLAAMKKKEDLSIQNSEAAKAAGTAFETSEAKRDAAQRKFDEAQNEVSAAAARLSAYWASLHGRTTEPCGGRWITTERVRHRLTVLVLANRGSSSLEINVTERQRRTHLADDIVTLLQLVPTLETKGDAPRLRFAKRVYDLAEVRANLDVIVLEPTGTKSKELAKQSFVTGPPEHWSLSANAVLTKVEETKVTDEGTLQLENTPDKFLFGLDYTLGDLLSESRGFTDGLGFKFLVEASSRPGDRLGLALTYRGGAGPLSFHLISPYVGALWTRSQTLDEEGNVVSRGDLEGPDFVVGLSVNLDRAVEWLKPKKAGS